jgi:purine-binding chemotaxis protein CheW
VSINGMASDGQWADGERVARTLRARAHRLAAPPPADQRPDEIEVLLCRVGAEQYAVPLDALRGLQRAQGLTPVPCTPPFVAGLLNVRGELVTVLDLKVALDLGTASVALATSQVLLVEAPHGRVGLLVDDVLGVQQVSRDGLAASLSGHDFAAGVAAGRTVLLAVDRLLGDARFEVYEEIA